MYAKDSITIDMAAYGMEGTVVVREPRFSRRKMAENAMGRMARMKNGAPDLSEVDVGDLQVVDALAYVDSAPFPLDLFKLDGFYAYCDSMDDRERGSAVRFWNDLTEAVERVKEGDADPLDGSAPGSPTASSD